ncbi:hypothetical protein SPLA10_PHROGS00064 [Salmonella phage SPLA10]|nr:hypothetical protein SPLA10_PHROGS00064 [Salmonella phage SPLA10]
MHMETVMWTGWADADSYQGGKPPGQWGHAANYPTDPWQTCYNDVPQFWAIDFRGIAQRYPGWNLDALYVQTWSRKKKHSTRHTVTIVDYFAPSWQQNPNSQPYSAMVNAPPLAPPQYIWTSKNGVRPKQTTHYFYRAIPTERYHTSPLYISIKGDPNSRREYGHAFVLGFQLWREKPGFPGSVETVLIQNGKAKPGNASQLAAGNWLSSFRGGKEYLP